MVIGIDASRANEPKKTGTEWYAWHVIQELKRIIPADYRVRLYSREPLEGELAELPPNWESSVLRWPPRRLWTQLRLSWEMLVRPPDVLFVPVHVMPLIAPARSVVTLHDVAFVVQPQAYGWFENLYQHFAVRYAALRARAILTVSEFSKSELVKYFAVPEKKISVTPLGHEGAGVAGGSVDPRIAEPYLLFVGRIEWKKNIDGLLRAYRAYVERGGRCSLVLAGKRGHGGDEAMNVIKDWEQQSRVIELGYVSQEQLAALYAHARAFVFVSRYEGFGIPILEAMSHGVPVITSSTTSLPEVAGDAALLVSPDDTAGISAAMQRIDEDESLRTKLVQKGRERCKIFTWKRTAELTWQGIARDISQ